MSGGRKSAPKVKGFRGEWLHMTIDGTKASLWLKPSKDTGRALCSLCPAPNSFSINEGWKAVKQHFSTKMHQNNLIAAQTRPDFQQVNEDVPKIADGLKKMEELQQVQVGRKEKLLIAQIKYTAASMFHGSSGSVVDCDANLMPHLFHDSQVVKLWDIRRTKLTYFATHGLYPYFHGKTVQAMKDRFYSINFDESTVNGVSQLDINVSYLDKDLIVKKRMFTTVALTHGTTGEEIAEHVLNALELEGINPEMMTAVSTDGCAAMIGHLKGAQKILRDKIRTLPSWGGCADHDLANVLKSAVPILCPKLTNIFSALHGCLSKHSMHKKREFERLEEWVGLEIKSVPQFLSVRFRVIERCAKWMESQDRALYKYFNEMKQKVLDDEYEASETEMIVLENYLSNYIEVRLSNCFILDVCQPVMELISFFESQKIRIQDRHSKLVLLLHSYLSKFMKNAGIEDNKSPTGKRLLKVPYKERNKQLPDKDIHLGKSVEALLLEVGLNRESPEIKPWLLKVRGFYEEVIFKIIKYFSTSIQSSTLRALSVLTPSSWNDMKLDDLKKQWRVLGEHFVNIVKISDLPDLMVEVSSLKAVGVGVVGEEVSEVDRFFSKLSKVVDEEDNPIFPLLSKLGSSLCTVYNSGSMAERDFSLMNAIVTDKSRTSQLLLLAKMYIKAELMMLARDCRKCAALKAGREEGRHCHCDIWQPPEDLKAFMRGGQPSRRYKADLEQKKKEEEDVQILKDMNREEDRVKEREDMVAEVKKLKERAEKQKKEAKDLNKKKVTNKPQKRKGEKTAAQLKREEQRKKLKIA